MKSSAILYLYAGFLGLCGFAAFAMAGFAANARTALIVGFGTAIIIAMCGALAGMIHRNRAAGMAGIHVGLVLSLIFAGLFGWRAWQAYADPSKLYLAVILAAMALGSAVALAMLVRARPAPDQRT